MGLKDVYELLVKVTGTEAAQAELGKTGKAAEGAGGKVQGALGSLQNFATAAAPVAAVGGIALEAFHSFEKLGAQVLAFQRVTGDTAESSSKMIQVFHDYGIESDSAATLMGKFEKVLGKTPEKVEALGIAIAHTSTGAVDVQKTFENVASTFAHTGDETERAKLGAELFGKSWAQIIPVLSQGADGLAESFKKVNPGQILSQKDVDNAEQLRLGLDEVKHAVEGVSVQVGKSLVPEMKQALGMFKEVNDGVNKLSGHLGGKGSGGLIGGMMALGDAMNPFSASTLGKVSDGFKGIGDALGITQKHSDDLTVSVGNQTIAYVEGLKKQGQAQKDAGEEASQAATDAALAEKNEATTLAALTKVINDNVKARDAELKKVDDLLTKQLTLDDSNASLTAKYADLTDATKNQTLSTAEQEQKFRDMARAIADGAITQGDLTAATNTAKDKALAQIDALETMKQQFPLLAGQIDDYIKKLSAIPSVVATRFQLEGGPVTMAGSAGVPDGRRANGGPVNAGGMYVVGENGPELLRMGSSGGSIVPGPGGGGSSYAITVNVAPGGSPAATGQAVVDAIKAYERSNGKGWRS